MEHYGLLIILVTFSKERIIDTYKLTESLGILLLLIVGTSIIEEMNTLFGKELREIG
jgi:hypothetical protein